MRNGFVFKNKHSSEMGITVKSKSRSLIPETKKYSYDLPLADGSYDFSDTNEYGRAFYEDRVFEVMMHIYGDNLRDLERKAARIAAWLTGSGLFKFDDMSSSYNARVISNVSFVPERHGKKADVSVIFQSEAIGRADFKAYDGMRLGSSILLDSNIPLDTSGYFRKKLSIGENYIKFVNIGDFYVRPRFEFSNSGKNMRIALLDDSEFMDEIEKIIIEKDYTHNMVIDFEKCEVLNWGLMSIADKVQGNFFEFPPGVSNICIYTDAECEVVMNYVPRTIYDFDFSNTDWGDDDA